MWSVFKWNWFKYCYGWRSRGLLRSSRIKYIVTYQRNYVLWNSPLLYQYDSNDDSIFSQHSICDFEEVRQPLQSFSCISTADSKWHPFTLNSDSGNRKKSVGRYWGCIVAVKAMEFCFLQEVQEKFFLDFSPLMMKPVRCF